jgi:hypothetical protein
MFKEVQELWPTFLSEQGAARESFKLLFSPSFFVFEAYLMLEGSMPVLRHAYRRVEIRTVNADKNGAGGGNRTHGLGIMRQSLTRRA